MTKFNQRIKSFMDEAKEYILMPDMVQDDGTWHEGLSNGHMCCFGARVARGISDPEREDGSTYDYLDGQADLMEWLDVDANTLQFMLWLCGAHRNPFCAYDWPTPVKDVMQKFVLIEKKPHAGDVAVFLKNVMGQGSGATFHTEAREKFRSEAYNKIRYVPPKKKK